MNAEIILKNPRSIVIEITDYGNYETEETYEIRINDKHIMRSNKAVQTIDSLKPDTDYSLTIIFREESQTIKFHTNEEFVTLNVKSFGAAGDGIQDDTVHIQAAINSCPLKGRVYLPKGTYRVSTIFLKDNLYIDIDKEAVLSAFTEKEKFPVLPGTIESYDEKTEYILGTWEGNPLPMYAGIITGINVSNVVISGGGVIDGNAGESNWWGYKREKGMPFRPRLIYLNHCDNITIHGIKVQNSPAWTIHPYFSNKVRLIDLYIENPEDSPNTDGIDPESCSEMEILGVYFSVGDDCIAIKSGKIYMGAKYKTPCENIIIRNCFMKNGHGAVTIGSEMAGGVKNILVKNCKFYNTDRGLRIKTRRGRGKAAIIDNIELDNIIMDEVKTPFAINSFYFCDPDGHTEYVRTKKCLPVDDRTPEIKSLRFQNIKADNCHVAAFFLYGLPEKKIEKIELKNIQVSYSNAPREGYPEMLEEIEPVSGMGLYANNIIELVLEDVIITGQMGDAFIIENVDNVREE